MVRKAAFMHQVQAFKTDANLKMLYKQNKSKTKADLEGAQHGEEGLGNDKAEE